MKHDSQSQLNGTGGSPFDPYDADRPLLMRCACGQDHAPIEHGAQTPDPVRHSNDFIEAALVKALLPQESLRRRFLKRFLCKATALCSSDRQECQPGKQPWPSGSRTLTAVCQSL